MVLFFLFFFSLFLISYLLGSMQALRQGLPIHAWIRLFQGNCGSQLLLVQGSLPQQGLLPQGQGGGRRVRPGAKLQDHRPTLVVSCYSTWYNAFPNVKKEEKNRSSSFSFAKRYTFVPSYKAAFPSSIYSILSSAQTLFSAFRSLLRQPDPFPPPPAFCLRNGMRKLFFFLPTFFFCPPPPPLTIPEIGLLPALFALLLLLLSCLILFAPPFHRSRPPPFPYAR